jgi:ABC-type arginine/histidine transport system permease subunit
VYSLGEYDLAIARQVPVSLLESSLTIQLVVVSVAVTAFVSVVVVVIRKRKWREQDETDPQENSGP